MQVTNPDTIDKVPPADGAPVKAEDPAQVKIDVACRELVNNGFKEAPAYKKAAKCTDKTARNYASTFFRRPEVMKRVKELVYGETADELQAQYAKDIWHEWINITPLDYLDNKGRVLSPEELKKKPFWVQRALKKLKIVEKERKVGRDTVEIKRTYEIETVDKEAALQMLAKAHQWITEKHEHKHDVSGQLSDFMAVANERIQRGAKAIEQEAIDADVTVIDQDGE